MSGGYAYVVSPFSLSVIDVSDPTAPFQVGSVASGGVFTNGVAVSGGYAYVAFGDGFAQGPGGLHVIDVSDPYHPVEVGLLDTGVTGWDVAVSGGYAYVAVGAAEYPYAGGGLQVIDVSIPSAPVEVGFYGTGGEFNKWSGGVALSDGYVFLAAESGFYVFRECGPLFADGFESGDTSAWSATVP